MSGLRAVVVVIALAARIAHADCAEKRARLAADAAQAERWNLGWGLGFTAATMLQLGVAISPVSDRQRDAMWVGAAKSGIGALSHAILPLRIATPTTCAEADAISKKSARNERGLFFLNHVGGLALNVAGALILVHTHTWRDGLISFATGWPIGLLHAYTLPRRSWHAVRAITVVPTDGGATALVSGEF